jgi:hypothetical protein
MKYGLSYIVADSEELLEDAISHHRPHFDYISIILTTQTVDGIKPTKRCLDILSKLKSKNLIDEIIETQPPSRIVGKHCRNVAIKSLQNSGCDYGLVSDVDEFYEHHHIKKVKEILKDTSIDMTYVYLKHYWADEVYAFEDTDNYNETLVPFIFKVTDGLVYDSCKSPVPYVDPTRIFSKELNWKQLDPCDCYMHHFWMVRSDIREKFQHRCNMSGWDINTFNDNIKYWEAWEPGMGGSGFYKSGVQIQPLYKQEHSIKLNKFYEYAKRR